MKIIQICIVARTLQLHTSDPQYLVFVHPSFTELGVNCTIFGDFDYIHFTHEYVDRR